MIGAGKDIERGGEKIQDASLKVRAGWRNARERHEKSYDAARAACNSGTESQRDACRDKARADYTARLDADRTTYRRREMRSESEQERMEDAYEAARDRYDAQGRGRGSLCRRRASPFSPLVEGALTKTWPGPRKPGHAHMYLGIPACDPALNDAIARDAIDPERGNCTADSWREYWSCFRL